QKDKLRLVRLRSPRLPQANRVSSQLLLLQYILILPFTEQHLRKILLKLLQVTFTYTARLLIIILIQLVHIFSCRFAIIAAYFLPEILRSLESARAYLR